MTGTQGTNGSELVVGQTYRIGGSKQDAMYVGLYEGNHEFIGPIDSEDPSHLAGLPIVVFLMSKKNEFHLSDDGRMSFYSWN